MADEQKPAAHDMDRPVKIDPDPEETLRDRLKVDPDAPPAKRNEDEPVVESGPLKDQGDPLSGS